MISSFIFLDVRYRTVFQMIFFEYANIVFMKQTNERTYGQAKRPQCAETCSEDGLRRLDPKARTKDSKASANDRDRQTSSTFRQMSGV